VTKVTPAGKATEAIPALWGDHSMNTTSAMDRNKDDYHSPMTLADNDNSHMSINSDENKEDPNSP
jgi:hypothetical protein